MLPGRTEYLEKWAPVARRLTARGFAVASLDWRGQGLSDRDPEVGRLGHVGSFAKYQSDLRALLAWPEVADRPAPRVLLSHSMGGCIALRALTDGALAEPEAGPLPEVAIWSAPMWGLAMAPGLGGAFKVMVKTAEAMGRDLRAPPFRGGTQPYVLRAEFAGNVLTADRREWDRMRATARAHPDLTTGAPTVGWFSAALREMALLAPHAPPGPALVLLGEREKVVSAVAIRGHLLGAGDDVQLVMLPDCPHEPLMHGLDHPVGARAWAELDAFLAARGLGRPAPALADGL